jgi:hypothetical protein
LRPQQHPAKAMNRHATDIQRGHAGRRSHINALNCLPNELSATGLGCA